MKKLIGVVILVGFWIPIAAGHSAQKEKTVRRYDNIIEIGSYVQIPAATEPCTSQELEWWENIRDAHGDLLIGYKRRNEKAIAKAKARFFLLLYEGQIKSYRVPLLDRPPLVLVQGRPQYSYLAQKDKLKGTVDLLVEFRANGSVGDIDIINRLEGGLTESAIQAARQTVFLPAIKERAFVADKRNVKTTFNRGSDALLDWKRLN